MIQPNSSNIDHPKQTTPMKMNQQCASYDISVKQTLQNLSAFTCLVLAALAFCTASASAQIVPVLTWDAGNTNNGAAIDPGSGSWNIDTTTNFNWNNGSGNVSWTQTSTTAPLVQNTIFPGPDGAYQVVLDGPQIAVSNLTINASGYTFSGSPINAVINSLLSVASGKSVIFSNNFAANNNARVWQLGTSGAPSSMTVFGTIGGSQPIFTSTNGSTFYFAGISQPSVVTVNANVMQTNGTFTTSGFSIGRPGFGITTQPQSGNATFPAVFTIDGPNTVVNMPTSFQMSRASGGSGTVIVQNGATVNLGAGGTSGSGAQNIQLVSDNNANAHAAFKVYGGTVNLGIVGNGTAIGTILFNRAGSSAGSTAEFTQTGGVVNAWGGVTFGAASGAFTAGIAALTNSGGFLYIGNGGGGGITRRTGAPPTKYVELFGGSRGALSSLGFSVSIMP